MSALSAKGMRGARVFSGKKGKLKKIGKISHPVFHPVEPRVVGFLVKRPDAAMMVKRADRFLAVDAWERVEDGIASRNDLAAWDDEACARLGIDLDRCRLLVGQKVRLTNGDDVGYIEDCSFSLENGRIIDVAMAQGTVSDAVVGRVVAPVSLLVGYARDGALLVREEVLDLDFQGGVAEKAGHAAAKAKAGASAGAKVVEQKARKAADVTKEKALDARDRLATKVAEAKENPTEAEGLKGNAQAAGIKAYEAAEKGGHALGERVGQTKSAFGAFKEEFRKAAAGIDDGADGGAGKNGGPGENGR